MWHRCSVLAQILFQFAAYLFKVTGFGQQAIDSHPVPLRRVPDFSSKLLHNCEELISPRSSQKPHRTNIKHAQNINCPDPLPVDTLHQYLGRQ
jgi:hypothetical protein